jgi:hypothetical protein
MMLAGLAVVLVVALPATASGLPAGKSGTKAICGDNVILKSFSPKQGDVDRWVVIKGKHLENADTVWVFDGEGFDFVKFWTLDNEHIGFYIPPWAETGPLGVQETLCSSSYSQKKLVIH